MSNQQSYIFKTILWTVLMILGLSGVLIGFIFISIDSPTGLKLSLMIAGIMLGIIIGAYSLKQIIQGEQQWKQAMLAEILSQKEQALAHWKYPFKQWNDFKTAELNHRKKTPLNATVSVTAMTLIGIGIGYFFEEMNNDALMITLSMVPLIAGIVWWISNENVATMKKAYDAHKNGEIILASKGAVINNIYLIPFKFFGGSLTRIKIEEHYNMSTLCFTVRVNAGRSDSSHDYHIPIPEGKQLEAESVKQHFLEAYPSF